MQAWPRLVCAVAAVAILALESCAESHPGPYPAPPTGLQAVIASHDTSAFPEAAPHTDPMAPELEMMVTKSRLYAAALKHGVNPYLVMGLAWHESGWNASAISSAGAVSIMQVMPAPAQDSGPALLH